MLKFIAFHLFSYDNYFNNDCYLACREYGVKNAIRRIKSLPDLQKQYCLKVDISNYLNSIDVNKLLPMPSFVQKDEDELFAFFQRLLQCEQVLENGELVAEKHGAVAGTK